MDFLERLEKGAVIFDGGLGTMLQAKGLLPGRLPESCVFEHPDWLMDVHTAYLAAGSDVITADTFGANALKLTPLGYSVEDTVARAVSLARHAANECGRRAYVAVSVGPLGHLMKPLGDMDFDRAMALFSQMMASAAQAGADLINIETMTDLSEARCALLAARETAKLPYMLTMAFERSGRLLTGGDAQTLGHMARRLGASAVGFNCGLGPEQLLPLVPALRGAAGLPLAVNPNAGLPERVNGETVFRVGPEAFARDSLKLFSEGAGLLGGCCGTTPDTIAHLSRVLAGKRPLPPLPVEGAVLTSATRSRALSADRPAKVGALTPEDGEVRSALADGDLDALCDAAMDLMDEGAEILELRAPGDSALLADAAMAVQAVCPLPMLLRSEDEIALESAARRLCGIHALDLDDPGAARIAARYGCCAIARTAAQAEAARAAGVPREGILSDPFGRGLLF